MKIVVTLQLYYNEMWDDFRDKLLALNTELDLIVALCEDNKDISKDIKKYFPKAVILRLPNKGLDIGPFLKTLKYLKENKLEYDYLIKIHAKKSHYNTKLGDTWRNELVNSIIGDKETLDNLTALMDRTKIKMCGSKKWFLSANTKRYMATFNMPKINNRIANFIGGTMFIVDYNVLVDSFTIEELETLYEKMPVGYKRDHSIAHHMERIFGFVVQNKGYKLIGV